MRKCSKYSKRKDLPLQKKRRYNYSEVGDVWIQTFMHERKIKTTKRHYSCQTKTPSRLKLDQYIKWYIYTLKLIKYSITSLYFLNEKYYMNTEKVVNYTTYEICWFLHCLSMYTYVELFSQWTNINNYHMNEFFRVFAVIKGNSVAAIKHR